MNRFLLGSLVFGFIAMFFPAGARAQNCFYCDNEVLTCGPTTGDGFSECHNIQGGCTVRGTCKARFARLGFGPDGTWLASFGLNVADDPMSSGRDAAYRRVCSGFVVARAYSRQTAETMRRKTRAIQL